MQKKINWRHLILGLILNTLVAIAFGLTYYAYIIKPDNERAFGGIYSELSSQNDQCFSNCINSCNK